jgi:hypothetical protein
VLGLGHTQGKFVQIVQNSRSVFAKLKIDDPDVIKLL